MGACLHMYGVNGGLSQSPQLIFVLTQYLSIAIPSSLAPLLWRIDLCSGHALAARTPGTHQTGTSRLVT